MNNHTAAASVGDGASPFPLSGVPLQYIGFWFESDDIPGITANPLLLTTQTWPERVLGNINATFDPEFYFTDFRVDHCISFHGSTPFIDFSTSTQMDLGGGNFTIMCYGYTVSAGGAITANFMRNKASSATGDKGFIWHAPYGNASISDGTTQISITSGFGLTGVTGLNFLSYEDGTLTSGYVDGTGTLYQSSATGTPIGSWSNTEPFYWGDPSINTQPGYYSTLLGYQIGIDELMSYYPKTYTRATFLDWIRGYLSYLSNRQINPYA